MTKEGKPSREDLERVLDALRNLKPRQRDVFILHRFEGMSFGQIGARLGLTPQEVEQCFCNAMQSVHEALEVDND